jgi:hypothetical protein
VRPVLTGTGGAWAGISRRKFGDLGPIQADIAIRNRHWQSPDRYHKQLPNEPWFQHVDFSPSVVKEQNSVSDDARITSSNGKHATMSMGNHDRMYARITSLHPRAAALRV